MNRKSHVFFKASESTISTHTNAEKEGEEGMRQWTGNAIETNVVIVMDAYSSIIMNVY